MNLMVMVAWHVHKRAVIRKRIMGMEHGVGEDKDNETMLQYVYVPRSREFVGVENKAFVLRVVMLLAR